MIFLKTLHVFQFQFTSNTNVLFLGKKRDFENSIMQEVREEKEEQQPNDLV